MVIGHIESQKNSWIQLIAIISSILIQFIGDYNFLYGIESPPLFLPWRKIVVGLENKK